MPNDGFSRVRVTVRGADRELHDENLRAARGGKPLPNVLTYRTLATVGGGQQERYTGADFTRACDIADAWHRQVDAGHAADTIQGLCDTAKGAVRYGARNGAHFGGVDIAADIVMPRKALTARDGAVPLKPGEVRPIDHAKLATKVQAEQLIDAAGTLFGDMPRDMPELILDAGLRWGEAAGLSPDQWDPIRQGFTIDRQLSEHDTGWEFTLPKFEKVRFVVVSPALAPRMEARVEAANETHLATFAGSGRSRNPHRLMFVGPKGGWLSRSNFRKRYLLPAIELTQRRAAAAGTPNTAWPEDRGVHSLRHRWVMTCFAELTVAYSGDGESALADTSAMAGHHHPGYTSRKYLHADDDYAARIRAARNR